MIRAVVLFAFVAILPHSSDAQPNVCEERDQCPPLRTILNGEVVYIGEEPVGGCYERDTFARNTCDKGFRVTGPSSRACSGIFDDNVLVSVGWVPNTTVTCEPVCPEITLGPGIASVEYSNMERIIGSNATHVCNETFVPDDDLVRVCEQVNETTAAWSLPEETCRPQCPELLPIQNGVITYGPVDMTPPTYIIGTVATYECNSGFILVGAMTRDCVQVDEDTAVFNRQAPICRPIIVTRVNDTVIGDPLMTVPLYVQDKTSIMPLGKDDLVHLCFEVHGRPDAYFNLVSDDCVSVNARYVQVRPGENINIINSIAVHAVDSEGMCHNISVDLEQCRASVDSVQLDSMYSSADISVRIYPRRVRIAVPNCLSATGLVMWVFCQTQTFWSTSETNPDGTEVTFEGDAIRFVIARGLNLQETSHGILGQFWNIPINVEPFSGPFRVESTEDETTFVVTVNHPGQDPRQFIAWLRFPSWELERRMHCLYAGNGHAGHVFEVPKEIPANGPVIEGTYNDYIVASQFETDFVHSHFDSAQCA